MNIYLKALTAGCGVVAAASAVFLLTDGDPVATTQQVSVAQGMVVTIDQETGQLRAPTADEARNLHVPVKSNREPLPVVRRADGSESMKLDDRYTTYTTVERRADGSWSQQCSLDHDHALHAQKAVQ